MAKRLKVFDPSGKDVSDEVEQVHGRANPFGWSEADFSHKGTIIGSHYCGDVKIPPPYAFTITDEPT